ncbi:MAG: 7TM diverse intracellular signaling domain-containing protein [Aliarcobacter sp.]|nr:7TM diverse intracellular signaling domain-containing protein [Aliarcobacter sp.]MDD2887794.1 7TM diverse intracellular signaling domain-containing protein [Aliarcobacter sp.]
MKKNILILILFFISFTSLFADTFLINQAKSYNKFEINYFKDETSTLSINEIKKQEFKQSTKNNFNLGYHKGSIWFKFDVKNSTDFENFILTLNETFYETANLYYEKQGNIEKLSNSLFTLIDQREVKSNHLAFNIALPKEQIKTIYLELQGKYAYFGKVEIFEKDYFYSKQDRGINTFFTFILGMVVVFMFFTFFLYSKTKERIYLYYLIYSIFLIVYFSNICGLIVFINLQKYIYDLQLTAAFMVGFLILFSKEYLQTKKYLKTMDKILTFLSVPFFILGILVVYSYQPWNKFINNFSGLICILLIIVSIMIYFKGHHQTKYYIVAMVIYFVSVVLFTFMVNGVLEYTFITRYGYTFGVIIEMLLFSYILANRYLLSKEKVQLYLEEEVNSRTKELNVILQERELLLKELHHRVKNNFHMLIGMLWIEQKKEDFSKENISLLIHRIESMAMIHEYLHQSNNLEHINLKVYLEKIISNISLGYNISEIKTDIKQINVKYDVATSLGMIINEVLSNALKHNKKIENLVVEINVNKDISENIFIVIKDNGKGFNKENPTGLGLKLINQFCKKLPNSKYDFSFENGTKFELEFEE